MIIQTVQAIKIVSIIFCLMLWIFQIRDGGHLEIAILGMFAFSFANGSKLDRFSVKFTPKNNLQNLWGTLVHINSLRACTMGSHSKRPAVHTGTCRPLREVIAIISVHAIRHLNRKDQNERFRAR